MNRESGPREIGATRQTMRSQFCSHRPRQNLTAFHRRRSVFDVATDCSYNGPMRYEWDEAIRQSNIQKHGIDFRGMERVFAGEMVKFLDDRLDYGESRFITVGVLSGRVVVIAHTETQEVI